MVHRVAKRPALVVRDATKVWTKSRIELQVMLTRITMQYAKRDMGDSADRSYQLG